MKNKIGIDPIGNNVIIMAESENNVNPGGVILLTAVKKELTKRGIVAAIGDGVVEEISVGDLVIFRPNETKEFTVDGTKFLIVRDFDIFGVIDDPIPDELAAEVADIMADAVEDSGDALWEFALAAESG